MDRREFIKGLIATPIAIKAVTLDDIGQDGYANRIKESQSVSFETKIVEDEWLTTRGYPIMSLNCADIEIESGEAWAEIYVVTKSGGEMYVGSTSPGNTIISTSAPHEPFRFRFVNAVKGQIRMMPVSYRDAGDGLAAQAVGPIVVWEIQA